MDIDEYIESQPPILQDILRKVRVTIRESAPCAVEKMAWQMPTFWQGGNLIHFYAQKKHLGIYPGALADLPDNLTERLAGYTKTKGAIHFPYDKPIDYGLIADITKWRVEALTKKK